MDYLRATESETAEQELHPMTLSMTPHFPDSFIIRVLSHFLPTLLFLFLLPLLPPLHSTAVIEHFVGLGQSLPPGIISLGAGKSALRDHC